MVDDSVMTLKSASGGVPSEFSYRGQKTYHVTLPTFQARPVFSDRARIPPVLNALRDAALAAHFDVILYTFLPERVVLLIHGRTDDSDMKEFLRTFRASAAAAVEAASGQRLWKRTYLERTLRRGERPEHCVREIASLPVGAGLAASPAEYEFTGSFVSDIARLIGSRRPDAGGARADVGRGGGPRTGMRAGGAGSGGVRPGGWRQGPARPGGPRPGGPRSGGLRPGGPRQGGPRPGGVQRGGPRPDRARHGGPPPGGTRPGGSPPPHFSTRAPEGPRGRREPSGRRAGFKQRPGFKPRRGRTGGNSPTSPRGRPRR